ncbi:hypothetical protein [Aliivibrio fischeri]|uniref:hypothetical protein n=1 Tax=Aliivibrio fischeri TaxID=668 RepID=UPI001F18557A|nr:hypothetical protein [Aliivibrio fischeri]MCE4937549.1 hypothetical protein [Aliivibrio fischeri]
MCIEEMDIYYETLNERPDIGWFLQGRMVIEYMLRKRLELKNKELAYKLRNSSFFSILQASYNNGIIDSKSRNVLDSINKIRNQYAHELTYRPTLLEFISLWEEALCAFSDMTDGIEQGLSELKSITKLEDADRFHLNELFVQICHDL